MAHCVNRSSQEFIALAEQSNINPIILAAKVSLWQEKNGLDKFPTLENVITSSNNNKGTLYQLENKKNQILGPAIKELDSYLLNFLKNFNVKSKEFEELKSRLGVDALGATDTLNKLIWYVKNRNEETLPEEVGHMLVTLMGEKHPDINDLLKNITNWSEYEDIKKEYLPIYKDEEKVKIEAIGKLIAKSLVSNYKANGLNQNKLQQALKNILDYIKKILDSLDISSVYFYNQSVADHIAINVLSGNTDYIYKITNTNKNLNAEKEINSNPLGKYIINKFSSKNVKMTGSLAIAGTENIRRPEGQGIHDIDFKVKSFDTFEKEIIMKLPKNAVAAHYGWHKKTYSTFAYLIPKEGYTIEVIERKDDFSNGWITKYELYDRNKNKQEITQQNVIGVDFFVYKEGFEPLETTFNSTFIPASFVYEGKLSLGGKSNPYFFSRDKDQEDYVLRDPKSFIPFEKSIFYQTNKQSIKPGVDELFSSTPELANQVYEVLGYKPYFNWKKELKHYHKEVPHTFKPGLTKLTNGNYLVKAFRTDDSGSGSKGFGQRGKGLYLSITDAYPGNNINIVEFEISPSEILTYKQDKYPDTISYENLKDNFKGTFDEAVLNAGGKAFIGGINGSEDSNLEIVLYDKNLIEKAIASKKPYSDFFTSGKPYSVLQEQQAKQLYSQYLDTIFPDSKVKDIVYHGTDTTFLPKDKISFWTNTYESAYYGARTKTKYSGKSEIVLSAILNIKDPLLTTNDKVNYKTGIDFQNHDGIITENVTDSTWGGFTHSQLVINSKEQIHILGGKQDVEGFKKFVGGENVMLQTEEMPASKSSPETIEKIKELAKKVGIGIQSLSDYLKGNPEVNVKGINGLADLMKGVIAIAQGREEVALTEEYVHVATAIVEQVDPRLITELIAKIDRFKIYKQVLNAYKGKKAYQLSNGKPDIRKIKKEAVDKLIAELIINQSEGSTEFPELMEEETRNMIQRWWDTILDVIRGMYKSTNIDVFKDVAERVMQGELGGTVTDLRDQNDVYYQVGNNTAVDKFYDTTKDFDKRLKVINIEGSTPEENKRFYTLDGEGEIPSVTQMKDKSKMPDRTALEKFLDNQKKEWGTKIHDFIQRYIEANLVDENGFARPTIGTTAIDTDLHTKVQKELANFAKELIASYKPGTRFLLEVKGINQKVKGGLASTIDFMAVEPFEHADGTQDFKLDILDWKTTAINKSVDEDIHWAKQKDWKAQMGEYAKMMYTYGVRQNQIRKARMIPFIINYKYAVANDAKSGFAPPSSMEIGKLNSLEETTLYLLPVPINSESTGNPKVDALVKSLREQWEKLYKKTVSPEDRFSKILEINNLSNAIRNLHVRLDFAPLASIGATFLENAKIIIDEFKALDLSTLSKEEIDKKLGDLLEYAKSAEKFATLDQVFAGQYPVEDMTDDNKKVLSRLTYLAKATERMMDEIAELQAQFSVELSVKQGVTTESTKATLLDAEVEINGLAKTFLEGSKLPSKIIKLAANLIMNARSLVNIEYVKKMKEYESILIPLEKEASDMGKRAFDMIGTISPSGLRLIRKIDSEFWEQIKEAKLNKNRQFFLDNVNIEEYMKLATESINKGIDDINRTTFSEDPEQNDLQRNYRIKTLRNSLDITSESFDGYNNYLFSYLFNQTMIEEGHYSKEYEEMRKSKAALDVWQFFTDLNKKAKSMGYIDDQGSSFFPLIESTILQKFGQTKDLGAEVKDFFSSFYKTRINEEQGLSKIDPETGKVKKIIPKYFTRTDKVSAQLSTDLAKVGSLWVKALMDYESSRNLENTLLTLHSVEQAKGSLMLDDNGYIIFEGADAKINYDRNKNADILQVIIDDAIYRLGQDLGSVGNVGISAFANKVGKTEEGKQKTAVNTKKLLHNADTLTRALAVGLKPLIAIANWAGNQFQAYVNSGGMYNFLEDFQKNHIKVISRVGFTDIEKGLLNLIVPLNDNITVEEQKKLAKEKGLLNYLGSWTFSDVMMVTNSFPEKRLQFANAMSFNDNSMVIDGKIINIRQFLKAQDRKSKYTMSESERKQLERTFEDRVRELKESSSLSKIATIEDNEVVIPGVSNEELAKYRTKVVEYGRMLNGQMSDDNKAGYRRDAIFSSFMMFKNWMPKLISTRTLDIHKNVELDEWQYGRTRAFIKTWVGLCNWNIMKMRDIINGTDAGVALMKELLDAKREEHFKKTGQQLEITEEEFYDLMRKELQDQVKELKLLLGMMVMIFAAKSAEPPEDATDAEKNKYKWYAKLVNKVSEEVTFYYNPLSFEGMTKGSILPSLSLLTKVERVGIQIAKEFGDEPDKAHVGKAFFNLFPIASQFQNEILPFVWPEEAKDWGIRVTSESRR